MGGLTGHLNFVCPNVCLMGKGVAGVTHGGFLVSTLGS